jgi:Gas vesicle synthesis protein GvpL/GvpF
MPCLLYSLAEPGAATHPAAGPGGAAVEHVDCCGLRCFYSLVDSLAAGPEMIKRDALAFHSVNRALFEQAAIIPFRFPTTLESAAQIEAYLREHAQAGREALQQFRDSVQMELRLALPASPHDIPDGTKYLRLRAERARHLQQAAAACRSAVPGSVIDWRQRESSHGVRCFALIRREAVAGFQRQIKSVRLPEEVAATLSGPWPPTEFLPVFA